MSGQMSSQFVIVFKCAFIMVSMLGAGDDSEGISVVQYMYVKLLDCGLECLMCY